MQGCLEPAIVIGLTALKTCALNRNMTESIHTEGTILTCWNGQAGVPVLYPEQVWSCLESPQVKGTVVPLLRGRRQAP